MLEIVALSFGVPIIVASISVRCWTEQSQPINRSAIQADPRDEQMTGSRTERDRPHWSDVLDVHRVMLLILLILWLIGTLKPAPGLIAPGLDFNQSQPATRR